MAARDWESLSPSTRQRYTTAGRTGRMAGRPMTPAQVRAFYERGGDLRRGRGYHASELKPPRTAAPEGATERSVLGMATNDDERALRNWRQRSSPAWLPRSRAVMGDDTAAALSRIGRPPRDWKSITVTPVKGTQRFVMTVEMRRGYARQIILQDIDQVHEVARMVNQYSREDMAATPAERRRLRQGWRTRAGRVPSMEVTVTGSPGAKKRKAA